MSEPVLLGKARGRQLEHLGLDLRGSTSLCSPWFSQNRAVSVSSGSMTTRNLAWPAPPVIFLRFGNDSSGLKPWQK